MLQLGSGISFLSTASLTSRCKTDGFKCLAPRAWLSLPLQGEERGLLPKRSPCCTGALVAPFG